MTKQASSRIPAQVPADAPSGSTKANGSYHEKTEPVSQIIVGNVQAEAEAFFQNKSNEFEEAEETKIKAFPVPSEKCFYGIAGDFVRLIEPHTEASRVALLAQFLVYFGNIIGRSAYYKVEGDKHYTNLFCVLVGKTAQGRKGTSFGRVKEVFRNLDEHHERDSLTSGLASGEGLLWQIRDAVERTRKGELLIEDPGVADKRLLIVEGEFAQVLKKQGMESSTLSTTIRNLWDTGTTRSLTKNSPLRTTNAHVSIIGHITQTELLLTLNEVESANGYANRFLFFAVERARFLPFGSEVPTIEIGRLQDRILDAIKFSRDKGQMNFSREAAQMWVFIYHRLETSRFGFLAKVTQRASPYVLRLSLIFALLDQSNLIETQHLEAALAVWQYAEDSARYVFGEKLDDQKAEKILTALKVNRTEGLTRTEIRDLFQNNATKGQIDAALQYLIESNLARFEKRKTGRRPTEVWFATGYDINDINDFIPDENQNTDNNVVNVVNVVNIQGSKKSCAKCLQPIRSFTERCPNCGKLPLDI